MQFFQCSVFHVVKDGKWNGLEIKVAYVTRHSESFSGIYRAPLRMKAFPRYKRKTKAFHFPRGSFSAYISKTLSRTAKIDISLKSSRKSG